jgi:hypothetical protein
MRPQKRYEMIELVIPAGSTASRFNFQDLPQLRSDVTKDIVVRAIETYDTPAIPTDFNVNPVATAAQVAIAALTLYIEGEESIFRMPLLKLKNVYNSVATNFFTSELNQFENLQIDWTKSYISTPTPFNPEVQFAFIFGIVYQRLKAGTMQKLREARGNFDCLPGGIQMM